MSDLDTEIKGRPADIMQVATWLRSSLRTGLDSLGDEVARQRSGVRGDWEGETATAFADRAQTLVAAADDGAAVTGRTATLVEGLARALQSAQDSMAAVRDKARAGDLTVSGFVVHNPGSGPPSAGASPSPDATPGEWDAWERADRAVREHNARVAVWDACVLDAEDAYDAWLRALDAAAAAWKEHDSTYVGLTGALLTSGIQLELIRRTTPVLVAEVDDMLTRAARLREHAEALRGPGGSILDSQHFYDLLDEADRLEAGHPARRQALNSWELPRGLTRTLVVVDIAATGYAIHSDWAEEGPAQAITSNAVPAAASVASGVVTGAAAGAVVGSFVPIPGVGTAVGVVVGAGVGLAVGAFTSGAIDSLFDSGADTLGDWGGAVADGFDEIGDQVGGVVDGVGDVFDSIF